jgi:putative flippase GtrA
MTTTVGPQSAAESCADGERDTAPESLPVQRVPARRLTAPQSRFLSIEALSFLIVGGLGYVVDVGVFNVLWGMHPFDTWDPIIAKVAAVALAMVVTYLGNAFFTWRRKVQKSLRQVLLFVAFNVIGLGLSIVTLWISHDLLGLTSRLDDNLSANVLGLALGTAFRFWSYHNFVFDRPDEI